MKIMKLLERDDGTQVKLFAELFIVPSQQESVGYYLLTKKPDEKEWTLVTSDNTTPKGPRNPIFNHVTYAEVIDINRQLMLESKKINDALLKEHGLKSEKPKHSSPSKFKP